MLKHSVADFMNGKTGYASESLDRMCFFLLDAELLEGIRPQENEPLHGGKAQASRKQLIPWSKGKVF